jgi:hypothetical protein
MPTNNYLPIYLLHFLETNIDKKECLKYLILYSDDTTELCNLLLNEYIGRSTDPEYCYIAYSLILERFIDEYNQMKIFQYAHNVFSTEYITYDKLVEYFDSILSHQENEDKSYLRSLVELVTNLSLKIKIAKYCRFFDIEFQILDEIRRTNNEQFAMLIDENIIGIEDLPIAFATNEFINSYLLHYSSKHTNIEDMQREVDKLIKNPNLNCIKLFHIVNDAINHLEINREIKMHLKNSIGESLRQKNVNQKIKIYFFE